jgi:hypothetical protein
MTCSAKKSLMAVPFKSGSSFLQSTPKPLFAVSDKGQRFLVIRAVGEAAGRPITVVLNWQAGIEK